MSESVVHALIGCKNLVQATSATGDDFHLVMMVNVDFTRFVGNVVQLEAQQVCTVTLNPRSIFHA